MTDGKGLSEETDAGADGPKVFLSYSRKDRERASAIADVLRERHFGVFKDTDDILPTEEWKGRLEDLIEEADTIVFLLSPHSATSEVCAWEVEYATALNKRIAPIVIEDVEGDAIPPLLARLNFIFCTDRDPFENAVSTLVSALNTDIEWIREHTRIAGLARRWEEAGRPPRLLLRGQDIADTEGWRDTRPADAPAVTAAQASFIAESRKAAGRRQRNWVAGSIAVTAATAALAVFAYFQSAEAESQRIEAEAQRGIAEENAAEAQRQRAEAEARRAEALKRLAADRLRAGDRAGGVQALMQAEPEAPQIPTLMAGLRPGSGIFPKGFAGIPLSINGRIHVSTTDGPPLPIAPFPAKSWLLPGENLLLISETGAMRLHDRDGFLLGENRSDFAFSPCFAEFAGDGMRVFGTRSPGYSACSPRLIEVDVTSGGEFTTTTKPFCINETVSLEGTALPVEDVGGLCLGIPDEEDQRAILSLGANITTPIDLGKLAFPMALDEHSGLWTTNRPFEEEAQTAQIIAEVRALPLDPDARRNFAIMNFEGSPSGGYYAPDLMSDERMELAASLSFWGGTGGEVYVVCSGPPGQTAECAYFHTFSGFDGVAKDATQRRFAIFGNGLTPEGFEGDTANLWLVDEPGATPRSIPNADVYGPISDVAFHPDGRIAVLTSSALLILEAETEAISALPAPEGAEALSWFADGEIIALSPGALHVSQDGQSFDRIPIDLSTDIEVEDTGIQGSLWLTATPDEETIMIGKGDLAMLFDRALRAPISNTYITGDPRLTRNASAAVLERIAQGGFRLSVNGITYERAGYDGANPEDRLDPEAPFR